jgi:hypothetical protein
MAIEKLKRHMSPGINQIPADLIKVGNRTIRCEIHKINNSIWNKEELPEEWKESIIVPIIRMVIKETVLIIEVYHFVSCVQNFTQHPAVEVNSICSGDFLASSVLISKQQVNY